MSDAASKSKPEIKVPTLAEAGELIRSRGGFTENDAGCWIWDHATVTGYGPYLPFYEAVFGPVPAGLEVYHLCHGGPEGCVRPTHMDIAPPDSKMKRIPDPALTVEQKDDFAHRIEEERLARKASKQQFAKELGVSSTTLRDWVSGVSAPLPDTYRRISKKMGWDGHERRFRVTALHQRVIVARSAGEAVRQFHHDLNIEGETLKTEIVRAEVVA